MKLKLVVGSGLIALASAFGCNAATLQHAEFTFDGAAIAENLKSANIAVESGQTTLYCQAVVTAIGATDKVSCFNKQGKHALASEVAEAVGEHHFWPAHVNGKAIGVRVNFRVVVENSEGKIAATVLPNLGVMQAEYGPNYVEPQERLDASSWADGFAGNSNKKAEPFFAHADGMVRVAADVAKTGVASDAEVVSADRAYRQEAKTLRSSLSKSKFIPGYVNGKPVDMPYMAVMSFEK